MKLKRQLMTTPQSPQASDASGNLIAATRDMSRICGELAHWRSEKEPGDSGRLETLQKLLQTIQSTDERASAARRQGVAAAALGEYESVLKRALSEIQILEQSLEGERQRLSPRLDFARREQVFRSAYARTLSRH